MNAARNGFWFERTGAISWMACIQFFLAEHLVWLRWTLPYSFSRNYISDLGAAHCSPLVCSPWHALMNGSFVLQGLLIMAGAVLTWRRWNPLGRIGICLLLVCGLGVVFVGLVPEDADNAFHRLAAALHFLGGGLGMLALGFSLGKRTFAWISMATGVVILAATIALSRGGETWLQSIGAGALERVAAYAIAAWMAIAGAWLYWHINPQRD